MDEFFKQMAEAIKRDLIHRMNNDKAQMKAELKQKPFGICENETVKMKLCYN